jgi:hypothetical protein
MPHKYMGVTFPLYQEPKTKKGPNAPTPQRPLTEAAHYWPPEALPFAYAIACIVIVLRRSHEASAAYYEAIKALELPGCQALINMAKIKAPDTNTWSSKTIKKLLEKGKDVPKLPWLTTSEQYKDNADYLYFIERIREFIRVGFNRQADLAKKRPKVLAEEAPFLFMAVVFRTIAEYCKVKLENWNKYRPDDIERIMTGDDPTTRPERSYIRPKKKEIRGTYKHLKWVLHHDKKLLKYADLWYKSRVNPGSIEVYVAGEIERINREAEKLSTHELEQYYRNKRKLTFPSPDRIDTDIAPCDEATGYPRKWRR